MREGWTYKTFGEVGSFLRGKSIQKADFIENGFPCIHYGQIHTKFGISIDKHLSEIPLELYNKSIIASHGDVIIAITSEDLEGSCKSTAWLGDYDIAVSSHAAVYKHNLNPKFIAYYLRSKSFYYEKMKYARGFKVMEIKPTDIERIPIPVPPLAEQEWIVAELDLLSGIIEKKKEQLKAYDQLAQSIFYTMFGDPIDNPKGWNVKKMGKIGTMKTGYTPSSTDLNERGEYPYFKVGDMNTVGNEKYLRFSNSYLDSSFKSFPKGAIVFPKNGAAVATNKKRILSQDSVVDLNTAIFISNGSVNLEFIYRWICQIDFREITRRGAVPTLDTKELLQMNVFLPPLSLQEAFAEKVEAIERQKTLVQQSIEETQTMFDYTMDKYFG